MTGIPPQIGSRKNRKSPDHAKGLVSAKADFWWAIFFLVVAPLLPLLIEAITTRSLQPSTVFLSAALYITAHAVSVEGFSTFVTGLLVSALLAGCFGFSLSEPLNSSEANRLEKVHQTTEGKTAQLNIPPEQETNQTGNSWNLTDLFQALKRGDFLDFMYYFSFALMAFFGYAQVQFRRQEHLVDLRQFFKFKVSR